jgi:hypothetical protein
MDDPRYTPCSGCGKPVDCRRGNRKNPVCHDCRRARNPSKPRRSRPPLQPCGTHAAYLRHRQSGEQACDACLEAEADQSYRKLHPEWDGRPETRDRAYRPNAGRSGGGTYVCEQCGRGFERYAPPDAVKLPRFCSRKCADDFRNVGGRKASSRARRAVVASTNDGVTDMQIWDRDDWACLIPGCELGPLRADLRKPEPLSPSVDHIVPLSLGGTDTAPNKRSAHLFCNISRNNRMGPDDVPAVTVETAPLGLLPSRPRRPRCPVHSPRKPVALPWPKVAHYRPCRWCGELTLCARPSRSPWTVCQACSRGECVRCGAGMVIVVNSSPPGERFCHRCPRALVAEGGRPAGISMLPDLYTMRDNKQKAGGI